MGTGPDAMPAKVVSGTRIPRLPLRIRCGLYIAMVMDCMVMGCLGLSLLVCTVLIFFTRSMPSVTFPKTGCEDGEDLSNLAPATTFLA